MTGEHLSPDIRLLVRLFDEHRVRYMLVGGEAVIHLAPAARGRGAGPVPADFA